MNAYAKAVQLSRLLQAKQRIEALVDPDPKLLALVQKRIDELGLRKEEVDEETGEIR